MRDGQRWAEIRAAYAEAAAWFVRTVPGGPDGWEGRALGEWTVRDLVGHTSRALLTVKTYLREPASSAGVSSAIEYFRLLSAGDGVLVTVLSPAPMGCLVVV